MASNGLNIGLRALLTAQSNLDTVGHNIANANTPGYSRQTLAVSASRPRYVNGLQIGTGVQADRVLRAVDEQLARRIVAQVASVSRLETMAVGMQGIEALLGEPGGFGLGGLMGGLFESFGALSADPSSPVLRGGVVQSASSLVGQFHQLADELDAQRGNAAEQVFAFLGEVNLRAEEIADLNVEISRAESAGVIAGDLRDQRAMALEALGRELDVTYHENGDGSVRVLVGGQLLVGRATARPLEATFEDGRIEVFVAGGTEPILATGGAVGGSQSLAHDFVPRLETELDRLARALILETNRAHATGVPTDGGFRTLTGVYPVVDGDGDGAYEDQLLVGAGLPFDIRAGELVVNVTDDATGAVATHRIAIDPQNDSVSDLLAALNAVQDLTASLDSSGHLKLQAASGHRFDFARRLNAAPDTDGTLGGPGASHGGALQGPFGLIAGSTLNLTGPVGPVTVTFQPGQFTDMSAATPEEVAAAINAEPGMAANQLRAVAVDGRVFLQSVSGGATQGFTINGGSAAAALGFTPGTNVSGHATGVDVEVGGSYSGAANQELVFRASTDGTIGTTAGLQILVETAAGVPVATLDVGAGYLPGSELEVADGVTVSFGFGELSATDRDRFTLDLVAQPDSSDTLAAFGLNAFFEGTDASTIAVRSDLASDPRRLAASGSGAAGDNGVLLALMDLQNEGVDDLEGASFSSFYGGLVGDVGFEVATTGNALQVEESLRESMIARRDQVSGVNLDEELVNMIQFEQAFGAASQFLQVVNTLNDAILNML